MQYASFLKSANKVQNFVAITELKKCIGKEERILPKLTVFTKIIKRTDHQLLTPTY